MNSSPIVSQPAPNTFKANHDEIASMAYRIYVERGCREGCAQEDWFEAERRLQEKPETTATQPSLQQSQEAQSSVLSKAVENSPPREERVPDKRDAVRRMQTGVSRSAPGSSPRE